MKTLNSTKLRIFIFTMILFQFKASLFCQDSEQVQTLFNKDTKIGYLWSPGIKFNSVQNEIGSVIELYGGPLFNKSFLLGMAGGVNFGHPRVNFGYFGLISQYIFKPNKLLHFSGQMIVAYGSTKDYEQEKSSLFDNFWNISGTSYFLVEPGINMELNLKDNMKLTTGLSYRFVSGLEEDNEYVSLTNVTNNDMSGINLRIGLIFGKTSK